MARQLTTEQTVARDEKRAKFQAMALSIAEMTDDQRAELASKMPALATIEGRPLSMHNSCLIATQLPTATIVGGFRQWLAAGRCVAKGQRGLSIWIPTSRKGKSEDGQADGTADVYFVAGTVFDISQTVELDTQPNTAE